MKQDQQRDSKSETAVSYFFALLMLIFCCCYLRGGKPLSAIDFFVVHVEKNKNKIKQLCPLLISSSFTWKNHLSVIDFFVVHVEKPSVRYWFLRRTRGKTLCPLLISSSFTWKTLCPLLISSSFTWKNPLSVIDFFVVHAEKPSVRYWFLRRSLGKTLCPLLISSSFTWKKTLSVTDFFGLHLTPLLLLPPPPPIPPALLSMEFYALFSWKNQLSIEGKNLSYIDFFAFLMENSPCPLLISSL